MDQMNQSTKHQESFVRWQGITIAQLGYAVGLLLSIATAMLGCNKKADTAVEKAALETGIESPISTECGRMPPLSELGCDDSFSQGGAARDAAREKTKWPPAH